MARVLDEDELVGHWTLLDEEMELLAGRRGPTKLAFALMLKFHQLHGRFPRGRGELPDEAVEYVAAAVKVPASDLALYEWDGRTSKAHRTDIRDFTGFRECGVDDADKAAEWLARNVCKSERRADRVRTALLAHLKDEQIEPPSKQRMQRIVGSALDQSEKALTLRISSRISDDVIQRMFALIARRSEAAEAADQAEQESPEPGDDEEEETPADGEGADVFAAIREDPGNVSVTTMEKEVFKLGAIKAIGLPEDVFDDIAPGVLLSWRARVAVSSPSHLRRHGHELRVTLLAAYLHCRRWEITDALMDLLITTVHRINARADTKVTEEFIAELKRVSGKENILFKMTQAALEAPEETVSEAIYPVVPGGVDTLVALWHEYQHKGTSYRQHRQRVFKASYTNHYRAGLIQILEALEFGSTNTMHAPMMTALALIKRYKAETTHRTKYYATGETVPVEGIVPAELAELMYRTDKNGRQRILRSVYECGVFQMLRDKLRCKEIWVHGAYKWRNPDLDLPADFEDKREENYARLRKPLQAKLFTAELLEEMDAELSALHDALPSLSWLEIVERKKGGAIVLSPLDPLPEPRNLRKLKATVRSRWGVVPLLDMLTETALRTGCLDALIPAGTRLGMEPTEFFERMLLVIYALGTGAGIRSVAAGEHPYSEEDLRYCRRWFLSVPGARQVAKTIANATFAARQSALWGEGTTAVASDSTHFSAYDQNIFTEYHSRYKRAKRGVLIYWTVETAGAMAIYSQHLACSASEVHAMVEGAMRHETNMNVETNYVDSHGASLIGFGITRLLNFDLVARFKQINVMKLYLPGRGDRFAYPLLRPALTRPIRPDIIENNYDLVIKYATAIRQGTASTEALLRRFQGETTHPAYSAMLEVGCAQRTIFLARWLRDRDLQHETESGLNVVENYNGVNDYIRFGKRGELASNRREEQEVAMLCLMILQSSLGYINTLMIQDCLAEPEWAEVLTDVDRRGLTPLFTTNMTPYGTVQLRRDRRLDLIGPPPPPEV
ncbi:Tn3 family transposase [Nonomuraea jabiensis]|uniref:TnpA family transposase n=1 Tax=Nonomuraea jabiensis TaxID=882448 RepID=A0A7W9GDM5_9ACTN|nr:Tn3 family transposase [Nonomuraea jabiensis]MBB5781862.1 TnpA family transposase [Nonomuraea jabiensis]